LDFVQRLGFRAERVRLLDVQILVFRSALMVAALGLVLCMTMRASGAADRFGESRWCRVTNKGDITNWDCEYVDFDDCRSGWVNKSKGYCAVNPDWHPSSNGHSRHEL
jgi:hypothetical protein